MQLKQRYAHFLSRDEIVHQLFFSRTLWTFRLY